MSFSAQTHQDSHRFETGTAAPSCLIVMAATRLMAVSISSPKPVWGRGEQAPNAGQLLLHGLANVGHRVAGARCWRTILAAVKSF